MQIFPRSLNYLPLVAVIAAVAAGGGVTFVFWYWFSPKNLQVGYAPEQPIPYSHLLHAGELGMDCRYCHSSVERSQEAMIPPTQTCMGCHAVVLPDSPNLAALRESWRDDRPVEWVRVHKLPEHAYFDHSVHVAAGVGCVSCHGRIDQMVVVGVDQPIAMQWCLECHRAVRDAHDEKAAHEERLARDERHRDNCDCTFPDAELVRANQWLRPRNRVTDMAWVHGDGDEALIADVETLNPPEHCSGCHR